LRREPLASGVDDGATSAIADSAGGYAALTHYSTDSEVLTVEYKINLTAPAEGDYLDAIGAVLKSGRTLTICRLEVIAVTSTTRTTVAVGQQTLIRVDT
jgi:acyl-coenzyme A thioesterase PaaI-like protein